MKTSFREIRKRHHIMSKIRLVACPSRLFKLLHFPSPCGRGQGEGESEKKGSSLTPTLSLRERGPAPTGRIKVDGLLGWRVFFSLLLLGAAGWLLAMAYAQYELGSKNLDFILKSPLSSIFAETWLYRGNYKYQVDHDPAASSKLYQQAIWLEPSFIDPWLGLARTELDQGKKDAARRILKMITPAIANVSTWKMEELRFASELRDEKALDACLNYILVYLPGHADEACLLASDFWGGWENLVNHVSGQGKRVLLDELMRHKESDAAVMLWEKIGEDDPPPDEKLRLRFCQFMMDCGRIKDARRIWCEWKGEGCQGVSDGGFELEPLNTAFGWHLESTPDFLIERASEGAYSGSRCLHLRFSGKKNVALNRTLQVVPVESGRPYRLRFAQKARNLTTDQGIFLEVNGYRCEGLHVQSKPVTGTTGWTEEQLDLTIPKECEAITLQIRRNESLKFDCNISGDYWLDSVEMN